MKTYYAVIDTNVIVSSFLNHDSLPGKIVDLVVDRTIIPLLSQEILEEYSEVLLRNKFNLAPEEIHEFITEWIEKGVFPGRKKTSQDFVDKDDIVFFEITLSGRSTMGAYLVTGNLRHYPAESFVVTPRQMIEIIEKDGHKR